MFLVKVADRYINPTFIVSIFQHSNKDKWNMGISVDFSPPSNNGNYSLRFPTMNVDEFLDTLQNGERVIINEWSPVSLVETSVAPIASLR